VGFAMKPRRVRRLYGAMLKGLEPDEVLETLAKRAAELTVIGELARKQLLSEQKYFNSKQYSAPLAGTIRAEALARRAHADFTKAVKERKQNGKEAQD
jgi:hypothetical protein